MHRIAVAFRLSRLLDAFRPSQILFFSAFELWCGILGKDDLETLKMTYFVRIVVEAMPNI